MAATTSSGLELRRTVMEENIRQLCEERVAFCLGVAKSERELASSIKDELDKNCGGYGWNVVVGKNFGSFIFHKCKYFAQFRVSDIEIVIWKS